MEEIKILKRPRLKNPYLVCAWPGMGEVAFKAAKYLVEQLKAEAFAWIPPEGFFYLTGSVIKKGILGLPPLPSNTFYYYKSAYGSHDLIIFISNAQPDLNKVQDYCRQILGLAQEHNVKTVVSFAAMPLPIEHTLQPKVWLAATSEKIIENLKQYNFSLLSEGQISGMNGLFLGIAKREGFSGLCLLGEIPLYTIQIENPRASLAVLEALSKILDLKINFSGLIEQAQTVEEEINKLLDYLKIGPQVAGPISEEEIERIKKSLSQLTKLPISVKKKIEALFHQAKSDISKANELKSELDKWNVYKEFEDRFLDLFKEGRNKIIDAG